MSSNHTGAHAQGITYLSKIYASLAILSSNCLMRIPNLSQKALVLVNNNIAPMLTHKPYGPPQTPKPGFYYWHWVVLGCRNPEWGQLW